jgi:hypothetical protein
MPRVPRFQAFAAPLLATALLAAGPFSAHLALAQQLPHLAGTPTIQPRETRQMSRTSL